MQAVAYDRAWTVFIFLRSKSWFQKLQVSVKQGGCYTKYNLLNRLH